MYSKGRGPPRVSTGPYIFPKPLTNHRFRRKKYRKYHLFDQILRNSSDKIFSTISRKSVSTGPHGSLRVSTGHSFFCKTRYKPVLRKSDQNHFLGQIFGIHKWWDLINLTTLVFGYKPSIFHKKYRKYHFFDQSLRISSEEICTPTTSRAYMLLKCVETHIPRPYIYKWRNYGFAAT